MAASVTQIKQAQTVHLIDGYGKALCIDEVPAPEDGSGRPVPTVHVEHWRGGFTPASLGSRICRDCEEKAGTAGHFEPGEKPEDRSTWKAIDE